MFHFSTKLTGYGLLAGILTLGFLPTPSFSLGQSSAGEDWQFPSELLQFDEPGFDQDITSYHDSSMQVPLTHAWSVLGKQEAPAHLNLGIYYHQQKRYELAESEYKRSLNLNPANPHTHFNLGIVYFDQKKLEDAGEEYRKALSLDPTFGIAHNNLGTLHLTKKEYGQAENEFKQALNLNPDDLKARVNLGHIYFYVEKDYLAAKENYEKALKLNPSIQLVQTNLATIEEDQKKALEKQQEFETSLQKEEITDESFVETFEPETATAPPSEEPAQGLFSF